MKAAIAVDDWKLPVFRKRLTEGGFKYTDAGALTGNSTILTVEYISSNFSELSQIVQNCQNECARKGKPKP